MLTNYFTPKTEEKRIGRQNAEKIVEGQNLITFTFCFIVCIMSCFMH